MLRHVIIALAPFAAALAQGGSSHAGVSIFQAAGDFATVQTQVNAFRNALGPLNPNTPGAFGSGRREINWDAVPDALSSPNPFPGNFFNFTAAPRARGAVFSTLEGSHLECSARNPNPTSTPVRFGHLDPSYEQHFAAFSPQRLFSPIGDPFTLTQFFVPGTVTVPAGVLGFGVVFTGVNVDEVSGIVCFDENFNEIGVAMAPPARGDGQFSFAAVLTTGPVKIASVGIFSGNQILAAGSVDDLEYGLDAVAMDDFIYGEPISLSCPTDLNGDGQVDGADLGLLLAAWGPVTAHPADFNGDGVVWGEDIGAMLAAWGDCQ